MVTETIRKIIERKKLETQIRLFLRQYLRGKGFSDVQLQKMPLGDKVIIYAARPGMIIGKAGEGLTRLQIILKKKFNLSNPQVEVKGIRNPYLDANIMAERVALLLERYGVQRFKAIGYRVLQDILKAGAKGAEIIMSGKIPGQRAKSWRFFAGYMKKTGQMAIEKVRKGFAIAYLKPGVVGVKVRILPPERGPDEVYIKSPEEISFEELSSIDPEIAKRFTENFSDILAEKEGLITKEEQTTT